MPSRYRLVERLRKRMHLYRLSNSIQHRNPFRYLIGNKYRNPFNKTSLVENEKHFQDEMHAKLLSHQWSNTGSLTNKWNYYKNRWFDARMTNSFLTASHIDSHYLSKHLLRDMHHDDLLKSKWIKFTKKKLLRLGNASMNNKIAIYHRGEHFFESLWRDIQSADEQILMETYIMEPDPITIHTIKLLTDASLRGVSVTLIIDSFGASAMKIERNPYLNELRRAGAVVLEYNKVKVSRFFEFVLLRGQIPYIFAYRNHKKIIVIDDKIGYTGGMNISGEYCGLEVEGGINKFRDTHCRLQGDIIRYLKESLYFSVLDINPTLPPPTYQFNEEEEEEDTDVDDDDDDDDEQQDDDEQNNHKVRQDLKNVHFDESEIQQGVSRDAQEVALLERDKQNMAASSMLHRFTFPYQMLPGFVKNFNASRKVKRSPQVSSSPYDHAYHDDHHEQMDIVHPDSNSQTTEAAELSGRRQRWHETWKQMTKRHHWSQRNNVYHDTYKNRLKILASSPRKSLSEWLTYYNQHTHEKREEEVNQAKMMTGKPSISALEVSALNKLMEEVNQAKNFSYRSREYERAGDEQTDADEWDSEGNLYIQVLESYRDKRFRNIQKALMNAIDNACSHIFIMNPYFLPPVKLKRKLQKASDRGVEIRIISCDQSDVPFISMASRHIYEDLLGEENIRLFEYEGNDSNECANILHAKMCLIDDVFVSLGSFNWDDWSYTKNLEMNLMIVDDKVAKKVHEQFVVDQSRSKEITLENVQKDRALYQKCVYCAAYLVSRIANRMF